MARHDVVSEGFPEVLSMRERSRIIERALADRLEEVLPVAMREAGLDMWLIICQEDDLDPVFETMIPMDTWCPILQMLVFYDRGPELGVERINLSFTDTKDLYDKPWPGRSHHREQWTLLRGVVEERNPMRIGINVGSVQWAAGGLTHNLYNQLAEALPQRYVDRLVSAEPCATRWLATLTDMEVGLYEHVVKVAHALIAECYSGKAIVPGVTTIPDLVWYYWQRCADLGLTVAFNPFFTIVRSGAARELYGEGDDVIRAGDFVRCDVGIRYLGLITDHQEWAYILKPGETDAPEGARRLMAEGNRLQDCYMGEFRRGLTGNQMLGNILAEARALGLPNPRVYSHGLGRLLHEPGPLIGLPWEQEWNEGRGDVALEHNYAFTMELSVEGPLPEWGGEGFRCALEQDVVYTEEGCRLIDGRQTGFHLV
jgi:Xaa-Pro aminopeptidase